MDDGPDRIQLRSLRGSHSQNLASFQEEWPFLRIEESIAEVNIHLPGIGFDLAEVRVVRSIQNQIRRDSILCCQAQIASPFINSQLALVGLVLLTVCDSRKQFDKCIMLESMENHRLHLRQECHSSFGTQRRRGALFRSATDSSLEHHSHLNRLPVSVANAF